MWNLLENGLAATPINIKTSNYTQIFFMQLSKITFLNFWFGLFLQSYGPFCNFPYIIIVNLNHHCTVTIRYRNMKFYMHMPRYLTNVKFSTFIKKMMLNRVITLYVKFAWKRSSGHTNWDKNLKLYTNPFYAII